MSLYGVARPNHDPNGLPLTPHPDWDLVDPEYWKYFMLTREHHGALNSTHSRLTPEEKRALFDGIRSQYPDRCPAQFEIDSYPNGGHYKRTILRGLLHANNVHFWDSFLSKLDPNIVRKLEAANIELDTKDAVLATIEQYTQAYLALLAERGNLIAEYYTNRTSQKETAARIRQITLQLPAYESALVALKALLEEHENRDTIFAFCEAWATYNYASDLL